MIRGYQLRFVKTGYAPVFTNVRRPLEAIGHAWLYMEIARLIFLQVHAFQAVQCSPTILNMIVTRTYASVRIFAELLFYLIFITSSQVRVINS